jgi:hypothetical protein
MTVLFVYMNLAHLITVLGGMRGNNGSITFVEIEILYRSYGLLFEDSTWIRS